MKIYISGKISGDDFNTVRQKFKDAELCFRLAGFNVVNPVELCIKKGIKDYYECLKTGISELLKCNAIYMLDDWMYSRGASAEKEITEICGILQFSDFNCRQCLNGDIKTGKCSSGNMLSEGFRICKYYVLTKKNNKKGEK